MRIPRATLLVLACVGGCAGGAARSGAAAPQVVNAPTARGGAIAARDREMVVAAVGAGPADVWPLVVQAYAEIGFPADDIDPASRIATATNQRVRRLAGKSMSTYFNCAGPFGQPRRRLRHGPHRGGRGATRRKHLACPGGGRIALHHRRQHHHRLRQHGRSGEAPHGHHRRAGGQAVSAISRRDLLRAAALSVAALALPGCADNAERSEAAESTQPPVDSLVVRREERLRHLVVTVRGRGMAAETVPLGRTAAAVGEAALGTPYEPGTLDAYLLAGGSPLEKEPLTVSLDHFDCVTLVESCIAIGRMARDPEPPTWRDLGLELQMVRYRAGRRKGYASRLHYFSEWIDDNDARRLVHTLGQELGGDADMRPLRFMSEHRDAYPALKNDEVYEEIRAMERSLDGRPRWVIPTARIPEVSDGIQTGDVLAFATSIEGLDVSHSAMAFRDPAGVLRVLHAPLSGGVVEITRATLPEYVRNIRRATGILVARPL
jgi:hypothetical protein